MLTGEQLAAVATLWKKNRQELVASFGGTSMLPTIAPGEEVTIRCGESGVVGDVIVLIGLETPIVHRIVAAAPDGSWLLTRGDANRLPDVPIRRVDSIAGRVISIHRAGEASSVPRWRDTPAQRLLLAICRGALLLPASAGDRFIGFLIHVRRLGTAALLMARRAAGRSTQT